MNFRANLIVIYSDMNRKTFTRYQVFYLAGNSLIKSDTGNWRWKTNKQKQTNQTNKTPHKHKMEVL